MEISWQTFVVVAGYNVPKTIARGGVNWPVKMLHYLQASLTLDGVPRQ
jgi:hypothetical protein